MKRISILVLTAASLACGAEDQPAANPAPTAPAAGVDAKAAVQKLVDTSVPVEVTRCLDFARSEQLSQAIPTCIRALEVDPGNAEVSKALADTRAKLDGTYQPDAAAGAAKGAANAARSDVTKAATSAATDMKDAAKGVDLP